jgi:hypothetical protein
MQRSVYALGDIYGAYLGPYCLSQGAILVRLGFPSRLSCCLCRNWVLNKIARSELP